MGRDISRSNHWALYKNDVLLSEGDIATGDPHSRGAPFRFTAGSAGTDTVTNVPVAVGDVIRLALVRTSWDSDFVGVDLRIGSCEMTPDCDDGDPCTSDTCVAGVGCTHGPPLDCDDHDPCTADACDITTAGCAHEPLDGCWDLAGNIIAHITASGTVRGHHVRCAGSCRETGRHTLLLDPDGTYLLPTSVVACPVGSPVQVPDEVGVARPGRHGKVFLEPTNLGEINAALRECYGGKARVLRYNTWIRPREDETYLDGQIRVRERVPAEIPAFVRRKIRFIGTRRASGAPVLTPEFSRKQLRLRECTSGVKLHCSVD